MTRKIIHLDLDAFYCAVEEQNNPALSGKPFAVGGRPEERGVVASCSYAARKLGIRSAMPMRTALKLCPILIIVSSRHDLYSQVSDQVMQRLRNLTPLVEQISIDEAFLDVSELEEDVEVIARRLQATINQELSLPCSLGISTNKLVAKIATDYGKSKAQGEGPPNAITIVPPSEEAAFLAPLSVQALWGIGPKSTERLNQIGVQTIGDLARLPEEELCEMFGKTGSELALRASGIDERPIILEHELKSISQETTFVRDIRDENKLRQTLRHLSERVGEQVRESGYTASTIKIKIRWPDFTTLTRQTTLSQSTALDAEIYSTATHLFESVWKPGKAVRLLGVGASGFKPPQRQLRFWDDQEN